MLIFSSLLSRSIWLIPHLLNQRCFRYFRVWCRCYVVSRYWTRSSLFFYINFISLFILSDIFPKTNRVHKSLSCATTWDTGATMLWIFPWSIFFKLLGYFIRENHCLSIGQKPQFCNLLFLCKLYRCGGHVLHESCHTCCVQQSQFRY